jgi:hypothetical protein
MMPVFSIHHCPKCLEFHTLSAVRYRGKDSFGGQKPGTFKNIVKKLIVSRDDKNR